MAQNPDYQHLLEQTYGIKFSADFFAFWYFFNTHSSLLEEAESELDLTGPFDLLLQDPATPHDSNDSDDTLQEARSYHDPPEFLTIATGLSDGLHWGYYVDDPKRPGPYPIAYYYSRDTFEIYIAGYTMFEVLRGEIEISHRDCTDYMEDEPEYEEDYRNKLTSLARLREAVKLHKTGDRPEVGQEYVTEYCAINDPQRQPVATTWDHMGIVVAPHEYMPLTGQDILEKDPELITVPEVFQREQEAMHLLQQGYPGAALKLGKDLWISEEYRETSYTLLRAAYTALDRPLLLKFLEIAIEHRADCDAQRES